MKSSKKQDEPFWRNELTEVSYALRMPGSPPLTEVKARAAEIMKELDAMKSSKELEAEIERLKEAIREITEQVSLCVIPQQIRNTASIRTQEDKIKELEGKTERMQSGYSEVFKHYDKTIQSLQEKVKKLEGERAHVCATINLEDRLEVLERRLSSLETKPQDCPLGKDCVNNAGFFSGANSFTECGSHCPKKQPSRREVIRQAKITIMSVKSGADLTMYGIGTILKALDIADQSLEGGEE